MKALRKVILPSGILFFALACGHSKHITNNNQPKPNWSLALSAPYDSSVSAASQEFYQPSATRLSDLLNTTLYVRFDWKNRWMYGKAVINAKPYFYPQSTLELDARGMTINKVALLKAPANNAASNASDTIIAKYTYTNNKLVIELGRTYTKDENYTVFIDYIAKPEDLPKGGGSAAINDDKGLYFINPDADPQDSVLHPRQIWTQGETQSNSVWMPTIDRPNERMTSEIYMTVDSKYVTLSNGLLYDQVKNADGTRTDHWRMDLPSAPYLVMMAVGSFSVVKDSWKGKEVSYYVEPQYAPYARSIFGRTPDMIDFFSKKLGVDFAWAKYSQICCRDYVSGAMENTTATLHSDFLQMDDREMLDGNYEDYISHELFHQWFGDLVTCESWSNLPLNESFATYGEYLWNEFRFGKEEADYAHYSSLRGYLRESAAGRRTEQWPGVREPLIRFYYENREDMFDGHSYNKGGQVLHLLRQYVGDDAFFTSLKLYLDTKKFSSGEVDDLRLAFEQTTGQDLRWFFDEWFMERGHPELDIAYDYDATKLKERVIIKQTQDRTDGTPIFRIPLSIDLYSGGKTSRQDVIVKTLCDTFYFDAATKPDFVNVDAQKTLPCFKVDHHTATEWTFLYANSTLYVDRVEAINALAPHLKQKAKDVVDPDFQTALDVVTKALKDEFWAIRQMACNKIDASANLVDNAKDILVKIAESDPRAEVRTAAVDALGDGTATDDMKTVFLTCLKDSSYGVISSSLYALTSNFKDAGMAELKKRESDPARSMKTAVGLSYAYFGTDDQQAWFESTLPTLCGSYQIYFIQEYGSYLRRSSEATINKAMPQWENIYNTSTSAGTKLYLKGTMKDMVKYFQSQSADLQKQIDDLGSVKNNATGLKKLQDEKTEADNCAAAINLVLNRLK